MKNSSRKGSQLERDVCRQLSLWFSEGRSDDLYWRSSQSGGRATVRARKGLTTTGHVGDIAATCSEGEPLTRLITFEIKSGYNRSAFLVDLLDRADWPAGKGRKETMVGFFEQAIEAAKRAGTPYWAVVHKRDGRLPVVYGPRRLMYRLLPEFMEGPLLDMTVQVLTGRRYEDVGVVGVRLEAFLKEAKPAQVRTLVKKK